MKMAIIFLLSCVLSFCDANVTPISFRTTPNQTENSTQFIATSSNPTTTVPTSRANPDHSPNIPPTSASEWLTVSHLLMVALGLILACTILLISTLLLAWKVCQLSRRLKMLSGHSDLMIPAKYWKDNNKSDADAKETAVLMADSNQARDEAGDGGDGPDAESKGRGKGEVCENGVEQKESGAKNEEVKGTPAAATEDPSSPKEEGEESHVDKTETSPAPGDKLDGKEGE